MTRSDDPVTTVKVPRSLRERIARDATMSGQTAAAFLSEAIDQWERGRRLKAVGAVYARPTDAGYQAETQAWDATTDDGAGG